jgi:hypothetical protein
MTRVAIDLLKMVGLYLAIVVGGLLGFLSLAPVFGYLPYSDRPGPGWFGQSPAVSMSEFLRGVGFQLGWSALLLPNAALSGLALFVVVRALEHFRTPPWIIAVVGALLGGVVSGYMVLGIGWYIAMAAAPVYFAAVLGLLFGALLLPRKGVRVGQRV